MITTMFQNSHSVRLFPCAPILFLVKFALAETLFLCGDMSRSLAISEELLSSYPQNVQLLEICAESSFALGKMEKSESYVVRVLSLEPENLRYVCSRQGFPDE